VETVLRRRRHRPRLDLPARFTVLDLSPTWVLGRITDDLDVERLVLYDLSPP
jgi:hypothetical protein